MAYEPSRGKHQAAVLYRLLRLDGRFATKRVAELAGIAVDSLDDWAANRAPIPLWAAPRLARALEAIAPGEGIVFLREVLAGVVEVRSLPRADVDPTAAARRVQETGAALESELLTKLTDERSPGRLDAEEVVELEPRRRAHLAATIAYDASSRAVPQRQMVLGAGAAL